jgi:hypothetical protein
VKQGYHVSVDATEVETTRGTGRNGRAQHGRKRRSRLIGGLRAVTGSVGALTVLLEAVAQLVQALGRM